MSLPGALSPERLHASPERPGAESAEIALETSRLSRCYWTYARKDGIWGAVRSFLTARRQKVIGVDGIDFRVLRGERVAVIGPNGAGKSTLVKLLTGIIRPTSGTVQVLGRNPWRERIANARNIGVAFGQRTRLLWDIPASETFRLHKAIYEIPDEEYRSALGLFTELLGLAECAGRPVRELSLGQRTRCELALAFLHSPQVLYLDEPYLGLDIVVRDRIQEFLRHLSETRAVTVLLTTHDVADIEGFSLRAVMLERGALCFDGSFSEIRQLYATHRILQCEVTGQISSAFAGSANVLSCVRLGDDCHRVSLKVPVEADLSDVGELLRSLPHGCRSSSVTLSEMPIEQVLRRMYGTSRGQDGH